MTRDRVVPLGALSDQQREHVVRHLPLVSRALRRAGLLVSSAVVGREPNELHQEGCLALMEAVRRHQPARHGAFGPYAMARIHYAVSLYLHERGRTIRVPFRTQRRIRERLRTEDKFRTTRLPRMGRLSLDARQKARAKNDNEFNDARTIGDLVRERIDRAMQAAVLELKDSKRGTFDGTVILETCLRERWGVPDPDAQMSYRRLANFLSCSLGRITHCEKRFRQRVMKLLEVDSVFKDAMGIARQSPDGMQHSMTTEILARTMN